MDMQQREQRAYMNERWVPPAWVDRHSLTPLADFAEFSSLIFCRERLPRDLSGQSFLIVNAGWGVDTHFFQSEGITRIASADVSERALRMTRSHCSGASVIAAATERLPFPDASFDFVGVRSGLHHLHDPFAGLAEMARVARAGFFFIEGHETPLTPLLVRLGFLHGVEEGGNPEYRFRRREVAAALERLGVASFTIDTRWFMQLPLLAKAARRVRGKMAAGVFRGFVRLFNAVFGAWGNAMVVVADKRRAD